LLCVILLEMPSSAFDGMQCEHSSGYTAQRTTSS
jgi:hypothetical protein